MERHKITAAVFILIIKQNKILLIKRKNTGYSDGFYSLPAGHLEAGETIKSAAIRELFEEVGVIASNQDLVFAHTLSRKSTDSSERIDLFFTCRSFKNDPINKEPDKCEEIIWSEINNLPGNTVEFVKRTIQKIQNNEYYSEYNWGSND